MVDWLNLVYYLLSLIKKKIHLQVKYRAVAHPCAQRFCPSRYMTIVWVY
uniref:Uncharacterized protein n=1 Tax=Anguilla anguilla TaxID=7936 RepID=A0A0E9RQH4_ANGAN